MNNVFHPVRVVARLTGLSAHVIRIWEHRYGAVEPIRTGTNRRVYSQAEMERLSLLRDVTRAGHSISLIAKLPMERLRQLAAESSNSSAKPIRSFGERTEAVSILNDCLTAVKALDENGLNDALKCGAIALGTLGLLNHVVAPLSQKLGDLWIEGNITTAHEHFASVLIRAFLWNFPKPFGGFKNAPVIVVATPSGQLHELGALIVAAAATNLGWQVKYLGASLPAADIAGAAWQTRARAVALSIVYPEDDPELAGELNLLRQSLPPEVALLAGGRGAAAYQVTIKQIGATHVEDLADLAAKLESLRKPAKKASRIKRAAK
jgi:DNA-binding transcriptional MerR regulator/methylmalonyl-CoA mutase cobalamin-binding subunit